MNKNEKINHLIAIGFYAEKTNNRELLIKVLSNIGYLINGNPNLQQLIIYASKNSDLRPEIETMIKETKLNSLLELLPPWEE